MKPNCNAGGTPLNPSARMLVAFTFLGFYAPCVLAQAQVPDLRPASQDTYQTIYLHNLTQANESTELVTDLRNMLPRIKVNFVQSDSALSIQGTPDEIQLAQKIISDLDRVKKTYRLTFTLAEMDGTKHISSQSASVVAISREKTWLRQGSRVPIITGSYDTATPTHAIQYQYMDVGLSIEASVDGDENGLRLHSKFEETSLADEKPASGSQNPPIRQTSLDAVSTLVLGKPVVLGSLDIPDSTHKREISVVAELVK
jgi:type II secretory pathway component GspD/PulD (secretin)